MRNGEVRDSRLTNLIAEELDYILNSASDPRLCELSVVRVARGGGRSHFVVYIAPYDHSSGFRGAEEIREVLGRAAGFIRSELATTMNLKRVPELTFMPDPLYQFPEID